jgi:hypothetical protein
VGMSAELEKLQGIWKVVTLEVEGREVAAGFLGGAKIVVDGEMFSTVGMGAACGDASLGIYELRGGAWRICLGFAGRERPRGF